MKSNIVAPIVLILGIAIANYFVTYRVPVGTESLHIVETTAETGQTYAQLLASGVQPKLATGYNFPVYKQFLNGCYGFSIKSVLNYKYAVNLDMNKLERAIDKPRQELRDHTHRNNFNSKVGITLDRYYKAETLLTKLSEGEPLVLRYMIPHGDGMIGHNATAYSFDDKGIRVADSYTATRKRVAYEDILAANGKESRYGFAVVKRAPLLSAND